MTNILLDRSNGTAVRPGHPAEAVFTEGGQSDLASGSSVENGQIVLGRARSWSLKPSGPSVFRCAECGRYWLRPEVCCGRPLSRTRAPYYVTIGSTKEAATPEFSVIVLTKNHMDLTRVAVESLKRAATNHSIEFIFVDCSSGDGTHAYFRKLSASDDVQLVVTHPEEPFIYSRNCNRGAQLARGRYLVFANNDIDVRDGNLFSNIKRALMDPRVGVVGTRTDYDCSNEIQQSHALGSSYVWSTKPIMGFLWAVRAEVFAELGGMDEGFTGYGCDEIDFEYRAIKRHYRIAVVDSLVHHRLHATFGGCLEERLAANVRRFNVKHRCQLKEGNQWYAPFLRHAYPRVSVAVAARNQGEYLGRALDSVLGNHLEAGVGLQIVVVNDASLDNTREVLARYARENASQITPLERGVSRGPAVAKNDAIRRCVGDYIALLDADDEFLQYKLQTCLDRLEESGAAFLYHDYLAMLPNGEHRRERIGLWSLSRWRQGRSLPPSTWMFRQGTVEFCEQYAVGEDPEWLRRNWQQVRSVYLPEALSRYYIHGNGLSSRSECRVVTGQLKGLASADVGSCSDVKRGLQGEAMRRLSGMPGD